MHGYQSYFSRSRQTNAKLNVITVMLSALVTVFHFTGYAQLQQDFPITNGSVTTMTMDSSNSTLYIGGWFDYAGPNTGNGVVLDTSAGKYDPTFPKVNGTVCTTVPDGQGGWYIGGKFTKVGKVYRNSLAHILSDGSVDRWNPNVTGQLSSSGAPEAAYVFSLALADSVVYIGGLFDHVGSVVRNMAAAVNVNTGLPTSWNPDADNFVKAIIATPSTIYLGGGFQFLQTTSSRIIRSGLASVDPSTGVPTEWNPNVSLSMQGSINCLLLSDSTMYVGGGFSSIGALTRNGIGAVNTRTGLATLWNPNGGNNVPLIRVNALELSGSVMYIGGSFKRMGTLSRNNLAAASLSGKGAVLPWNPNVTFVSRYGKFSALSQSSLAPPEVYSIVTMGSSVYVGGYFNRAGGAVRRNLAGFDTSAGIVTAWDPSASLTVYVLKKSSTVLYAGGGFTSVNGFTRYHLAAIDLKTKTVNGWDPNVNEGVEALALYGSKVFVGGYFDTVGTQNTAELAAVDKKTGAVAPWTLNTVFAGGVHTISIYKDRLYASGNFETMGDSVRKEIAAIDLLSGKVLPWYPGEVGFAYSFVTTDSLIYLGGPFWGFDGAKMTRHGLGSVDTRTGVPTPWAPFITFDESNVMPWPFKILLHGKTLYVAGTDLPLDSNRTVITGLIEMDVATGTILPFDPKFKVGTNNQILVADMAIVDSTLYAVGSFSTAGGVARQNIVAFDLSTGTAKPWNPKLSTTEVTFGNAVLVDPSKETVYMGGVFRTIDDDPASFLAAYTDTSLRKLTSVTTSPSQAPREFALSQNFPNPFNPTTAISYQSPVTSHISLKVYDLLGREVATLVNAEKSVGTYTVTWDASKLPSGVYFYQLRAGNIVETKKMLLTK